MLEGKTIKRSILTALCFVVVASQAIAAGSGNHQHMDQSMMHHGDTPSSGKHSGMSKKQGHHMEQGHHMNHGHHMGSASGESAKLEEVTKTIHLDAADEMKFNFKQQLDISKGDVVKFVVTNTGKINHEFSIGNESEQEKHRAMMRNMPDMVHEDGNSITVKPGETKELIWKFHGDPKVVFACNIPGHSEAGMMHRMTVGE